MEDVFEVKPSAGKGNGVFAKKDITPGTIIMRDHEVMPIAKNLPQVTDQEVQTAFSKLQPELQAQFLALHEGNGSSRTRLLRIYKSNAFGDTTASGVYLGISLINHACVPNAEMHLEAEGTDGGVFAVRAIAKGEEVSISYYTSLSMLTAQQRGKYLSAFYGFVCRCSACAMDKDARMMSDARRQLIRAIHFPLLGASAPDFDLFCDLLTPQNTQSLTRLLVASFTKLQTPLTKQMCCAYNFLLVALHGAETLVGAAMGNAYFGAASALLTQMMEMDDMIVVQSASNVKRLATKAVDIITSACGASGKETVALRAGWKWMQSQPQLYLATEFLGSSDVQRDLGHQDYSNITIFALLQERNGKRIAVLTEEECKGVLRGKMSKWEQ